MYIIGIIKANNLLDEIFDVSVVEMVQIIKYDVGQNISLEYKADKDVNTVLSIK